MIGLVGCAYLYIHRAELPRSCIYAGKWGLHAQELLDKCHPLGMFDSISTLAVASNMRELYRLVLVDTPLAPYFAESLTSGF